MNFNAGATIDDMTRRTRKMEESGDRQIASKKEILSSVRRIESRKPPEESNSWWDRLKRYFAL